MKLKKVIALSLASILMVSAFAGCSKKDLTPEEIEAKRIEQYTKEEAETGLKRMDSPNLTEYEIPLQKLIEGIQNKDPDKICEAVGSPAVLSKDDIYGWSLRNGYDFIRETSISELKIASIKNNAEAAIILYSPNDNLKDDKAGMAFSTIYENNRWILIPPAGVRTQFRFTAPVRDIFCGDVSLRSYATTSDSNGVWTFEIPYMVTTDNMGNFKMKSELGTFDAIMCDSGNSYSLSELIADMSNSQKDEFLHVTSEAVEQVFGLVKDGADSNAIAKILVSENMIQKCVPTRDEDKALLKELYETYTGVEIFEGPSMSEYPDAYTFRIYKDNGIELDVKIKVNTTAGECRRLATITIQKINDEWKISNIACNDGKNIFTDFNVFNPAW